MDEVDEDDEVSPDDGQNALGSQGVQNNFV